MFTDLLSASQKTYSEQFRFEIQYLFSTITSLLLNYKMTFVMFFRNYSKQVHEFVTEHTGDDPFNRCKEQRGHAVPV